LAAECFHTVFEADESGPFVEVGSSDTVVANQQVQVFAVGVGSHGKLGGLRVFGGVGERFGHHVIRGDFHHLGQSSRHRHVNGDRYRRASSQRLQRRTQSTLRQDHRVHPV